MSVDVRVCAEADELVSPAAFERIVQRYWVLAWRHELTPPYWWDWAFSLSEPKQVPNRSMFWRRPTYQEATTREWWFQNDRAHWDDCIERYGGKLRRYCASEPPSRAGDTPDSAPRPLRQSPPSSAGCEPSGAAPPPALSSDAEAPTVQAPIAQMARAFSLWLNSTYPPDLDPEAWFHRRIGKIHEEAGEVREATGAYWQENPRKASGSLEDVIKELSDCVGAALGAIEHLTGHEGRSLDIATERVRFVCDRVGVRP